MSEYVAYTGRLRALPKMQDLEGQCRVICNNRHINSLGIYSENWIDEFREQRFEDLLLVNDRLYKVVEKNYVEGDIYQSSTNDDGTISFTVSYYNGGCDFTEAIEDALENLDK